MVRIIQEQPLLKHTSNCQFMAQRKQINKNSLKKSKTLYFSLKVDKITTSKRSLLGKIISESIKDHEEDSDISKKRTSDQDSQQQNSNLGQSNKNKQQQIQLVFKLTKCNNESTEVSKCNKVGEILEKNIKQINNNNNKNDENEIESDQNNDDIIEIGFEKTIKSQGLLSYVWRVTDQQIGINKNTDDKTNGFKLLVISHRQNSYFDGDKQEQTPIGQMNMDIGKLIKTFQQTNNKNIFYSQQTISSPFLTQQQRQQQNKQINRQQQTTIKFIVFIEQSRLKLQQAVSKFNHSQNINKDKKCQIIKIMQNKYKYARENKQQQLQNIIKLSIYNYQQSHKQPQIKQQSASIRFKQYLKHKIQKKCIDHQQETLRFLNKFRKSQKTYSHSNNINNKVSKGDNNNNKGCYKDIVQTDESFQTIPINSGDNSFYSIGQNINNQSLLLNQTNQHHQQEQSKQEQQQQQLQQQIISSNEQRQSLRVNKKVRNQLDGIKTILIIILLGIIVYLLFLDFTQQNSIPINLNNSQINYIDADVDEEYF